MFDYISMDEHIRFGCTSNVGYLCTQHAKFSISGDYIFKIASFENHVRLCKLPVGVLGDGIGLHLGDGLVP
jgi:hypothetical protein